jgi:hypothetical protein
LVGRLGASAGVASFGNAAEIVEAVADLPVGPDFVALALQFAAMLGGSS